MDPGRELDALVAEKVMGYEVDLTREWYVQLSDLKDPNPSVPIYLIPNFSTDIAAAWKVVEKFNNFHIKTSQLEDGGPWIPYASLSNWVNDHHGLSWGRTTPHAICLAALKAIGVEI